MTTSTTKIEAIIRTLSVAVREGIHASLSPEDCAELLQFITTFGWLRRKEATSAAFFSGRMRTALKDFAEGIAESILDDVLDVPGPPGREGKK